MTAGLSAASQAATTVHNGLLNYWNLDGNANDTASALSGNASTVDDNEAFFGQSGSTSGISYQTGLFGSATEQDGSVGPTVDNGLISVPGSADARAAGSDLSVSVWIQTNAFDTGWQAVIAQGEQGNWRIARRGGGSNLGYAGGTGDTGNTGPAVNDGGWHHLVATTSNGGSTALYIDGALAATSAGPASISNHTLPLYIGGNPGSTNDREWLDEIDDVGMWNRVLKTDEINEIYAFVSGDGANVPLTQIPEPSSSLLVTFRATLGLMRRRRSWK